MTLFAPYSSAVAALSKAEAPLPRTPTCLPASVAKSMSSAQCEYRPFGSADETHFGTVQLSCPVEAGAEDHLAGQQPAAVRRIDAYEIINQRDPVTLTLFSTGSAKMRRYQLR